MWEGRNRLELMKKVLSDDVEKCELERRYSGELQG